jgi:hypothetical protein
MRARPDILGAVMIALRVLVFSAMAVAATASAAHAGSCSGQIDAMQARIDAKLEAKAAAGPAAKQGVAAGMGMQPTPASIARRNIAAQSEGYEERHGARACCR